MTEEHSVKYGNEKTLRWGLGRDLTNVTEARVILAPKKGAAAVLDEIAAFDDRAKGIVSLKLLAAHYGAGKLEVGTYIGEIRTEPGPLTHPDEKHRPYFTLEVLATLG